MGGRRERFYKSIKGLFSPSGRSSPNPGSSRPSSPAPAQGLLSHGGGSSSNVTLAPPNLYQQSNQLQNLLNSRPLSSSGLSQGGNVFIASGVTLAPSSLYQQPSQVQKSISYIPDPALEEAIKRYTGTLTEKEKAAFNEQSAKSPLELIEEVKILDENHKKSSVSRRLSPGVEKTLNTINSFMDVLSTCIQYSPEYSALVLGGFKCILQLALGFFSFFQKLADMMEHIEDHLSYLCRYAEPMFQKSVPVQEALVKVYCDLLEFCTQTRRIFTDEEGNTSRSASLKVFLRLPWEPYEVRLREIQLKFSGHADVVFRAAQVQGMIDESTERQWVRLRADMEDQKLRDEKRREAFKWLSGVDFEETHQRHFSKRFDSTGEWLLNDGNYGDWRSGDESCLLWCHGAPGAGKTVLSSLVTQTLLGEFGSSDSVGVAYGYCSYIESYDPATLVATFIKQLSRQKQHLLEELEALFDIHHKNARKPTFLELQTLFLAISKRFDKIFVVLDALDECDVKKRPEFLQFLQKTITSGGTVKLFVASRKEEDIQRAFSNVATIQIEATKVNKDIESYVKSELNRRVGDGSLKMRDPNLKEEIFNALVSKADGMFLWVGFQLDHICEQHSDPEIRKALQTLPEDLEQMYQRIIIKIDENRAHRKLARRVLLWVAYAEEPLALEQLAEAVGIELDMKCFGDLKRHLVNDPQVLVNCCANLVQVVAAEGSSRYKNFGPTVQFVHYSVLEFLSTMGDRRSAKIGPTPDAYLPEPQFAQDTIAQHCLTYMLFIEEIGGSFRRSDLPFVYYAVRCWQKHARALTSLSDDFWGLVCRFINSRNLPSAVAICMWGVGPLPLLRVYPEWEMVLPPLLNAALLNLPLVLDRFKEEQTCNSEILEMEATVMHRAVEEDSCEAVKLLCGWGYSVNALDAHGATPLSHARNGDMVRLLLEKGANVNAQGGEYGNALQAAALGGSREVVELLLERGVDVNAQDGLYGNALQAAAYRGSRKVVELLLERGVDVNAQGGQYGNALQAAASRGSREVVELLLERGADVNAQGGQYGNALQGAAWRGSREVVELLLERGADVNAQGGEYGNALQAAASRGSREVVELLLERGADVNAQGGNYGNALQAAERHPHIIRLLKKNGAVELEPSEES